MKEHEIYERSMLWGTKKGLRKGEGLALVMWVYGAFVGFCCGFFAAATLI